jgi:hypothetical protein
LKLIARIVITGLLERVEGGDRNDYWSNRLILNGKDKLLFKK